MIHALPTLVHHASTSLALPLHCAAEVQPYRPARAKFRPNLLRGGVDCFCSCYAVPYSRCVRARVVAVGVGANSSEEGTVERRNDSNERANHNNVSTSQDAANTLGG